MPRGDFSISITQDAVDVKYTPSATSPRGKLFGFVFTIIVLLLLACAVLFLPGKNGRPSMWHNLAEAPSGSADFLGPVIGLGLFLGLFGWQGIRYARAAWASDETFHCDRAAITISRVPWLDFSDHTWRTHTYPLTEVSKIRYAVIASAKGRQFWGLRFRAHGRKWALPGLEAPEAKAILVGLKNLGADVPDDPKLDKRIKQTLEMRDGDTSWMDRSWMDPANPSDPQGEAAVDIASSEDSPAIADSFTMPRPHSLTSSGAASPTLTASGLTSTTR